jgi:hypothetical protein
MTTPNLQIAGRSPNQPTCEFPRCSYLIKSQEGSGDHCAHPANRVAPMPGWPNGFEPSVMGSSGCDLHSERSKT